MAEEIMGKMEEARRLGEQFAEEIRETIRSVNPNALRERFSVHVVCTRPMYWRGWKWFRPKLKLVVAIRDWIPTDEDRERLIEAQYMNKLVPKMPEFLASNLHFERKKHEEVVR